MMEFIRKNKVKVALWTGILSYIFYFSWLTILRVKALYASYYDLGIMHQTVYNSYMAIRTWDWGRFLEMTNTLGPEQIKRMAIHNDLILGLLAPFYFINSSPYTLLVIQSVVLGLGALAVFKISQIVFRKIKHTDGLSLALSFGYLLYPSLQLSNIFEFHAVTIATTSLLFMFYFWLVKKYRWSFLFFVIAILTKEEIPLTTAFFGAFALYHSLKLKEPGKNFAIAVIATSIVWFVLSMFVIIPGAREGAAHFAAGYYDNLKNNPIGAVLTVVTSPNTYKYLFKLLGPVGFISLLSPIHLLIALPELAINLFSKQENLRNIIYHYTAGITPFIFISAIYGTKNALRRMSEKTTIFYLITFVVLFALLAGPLPFSKKKNIHPFAYPQKERFDVEEWAEKLKDEKIKVASTGQLSPFFTSRRYFYTFSKYYKNADYVVLRLNEIYNYPEKEELIPVYEDLILNPNYVLIYQKENFEVYKKI